MTQYVGGACLRLGRFLILHRPREAPKPLDFDTNRAAGAENAPVEFHIMEHRL